MILASLISWEKREKSFRGACKTSLIRVGSHLKEYDFMINLAHFKGHAMGGFGGVLKNQSIGVASSAGNDRLAICRKIIIFALCIKSLL